jgi:amino acid transporter
MPTPSWLAGANQQGVRRAGLRLPRERPLTLWGLMALAFFTTCGDPFGLEPLASTVGPGWAVVFILISPLLWSLPIALMVAELAPLLLEQGGYYISVRGTLGPFWAVQEAWWTMAYSVGLRAIFPVLLVGYITFFIPELIPTASSPHAGLLVLIRWFIAVLFIASAAVVNLCCSRDVGRSSKYGAAFVLSTLALMVLLSLARGPAPSRIVGIIRHDLVTNSHGALLLGLSIISFNFSDWDNVLLLVVKTLREWKSYPGQLLPVGILAVCGVVLYLARRGVTAPISERAWDSATNQGSANG